MVEGRTKVLYVSGFGRSGSTVFGNVLGGVEGFFHGGELGHIWDRGVLQNWFCGCGAPFDECELWGDVFGEAFGGTDRVDAREMIRLREASFRTHRVPLLMTRAGERLLAARAGAYMENLGKLYRSIQKNSGSRVIVDSSKYPTYGYALGMLPGVDLYVVHLVRDPRAVTYSWLRKKLQTGAGEGSKKYMLRYTPTSSVMRWGARNVTTEMLWGPSHERFMTVRYEDFVLRPRKTVRSVLALLGEDAPDPPFVSEHRIEMDVSHTISGNPNRFSTGTVELKPDAEWRENMRRRDRTLVTGLTLPLLARYGYLGRRSPAAPTSEEIHREELVTGRG